MSAQHDPTLPLSPVSLMLSLRTMFDREKALGIDTEIGFEIAGEQFVATLRNGTLQISRGELPGADAVFRAPAAPVMAALLYAGVPVSRLEEEAGLVIEGDRERALAYADIFELPDKLA